MKLGEMQELYIVKKVEFGVYLSETSAEGPDKVLLPAKQVPAGAKIGDKVQVFLYKDSKDRLIATVREPKLMMGQAKMLRVAQVGKFGAFLDWGLEKDLLLPFKQQVKRVSEGDQVLVSLYIDKSERLCATMNVYENLLSQSPYQKGDRVTGRAYASSNEFGIFVAVDNQYSALIPRKECFGRVELGEDVSARVTEVREDGRLCLSIRDNTLAQIEIDSEEILKLLDSYEGSLPFTDKSAPEVITYETGMSKNQFKRAIGNLLKKGMVEITDKSIRLK